ncbi:MAG: IclR family transcriptional regulator [Kineosporiaceae bacterium]|nr:IclR family transcriptional regulator [Kineosporiaceae bacterium]
MQNSPRYAIASVDNALVLLQTVMHEGVVRVAAAARELGVAKSTAHRLLAQLAHRGFVVQAPDRSYVPGPALSGLAPARDVAVRLVDVALPHLQALCGSVNETVHLMVLDGAEVRFVRSVESSQALRVGSREGIRLPARLTPGGLAILATLPPREVERLHPSLRPGSEDAVRLLSQLATTRKAGYGLNYEATETGLTAISVALTADDALPRAAVAVSAPTVRLRRSQILTLLPDLRACCRRIESDLAGSATSGRTRRPPAAGRR